MNQKGRYKLFSYLVNDKLIIYKSINKNHKILAFSVILIDNVECLVPKLQKYLQERFLSYFSLQYTSKKKNCVILCFEDVDHHKLLKYFNLIYQTLLNEDNNITFLNGDRLEESFIRILKKITHNNIDINKKSDSLIFIKNNNRKVIANYYEFDITPKINDPLFLRSIIKLIQSLKGDKTLIINFKKNEHNKIIFMVYLFEILKKEQKPSRCDVEINTIYKYKILKSHRIEITDIGFILWRLPCNRQYYLYKNYETMFYFQEKFNFENLNIFNQNIESFLKCNSIDFIKINDNILLIGKELLLYTSEEINYKIIKKIIEKYYSKFKIYLLILSVSECKKLQKIRKINVLKELKILSSKDFNDFKSFLLGNKTIKISLDQ